MTTDVRPLPPTHTTNVRARTHATETAPVKIDVRDRNFY